AIKSFGANVQPYLLGNSESRAERSRCPMSLTYFCFDTVLLKPATGAVAIATSPLPSGRASQRSPSPPRCPVKAGSTDGDDASILELPESGHRLLGTKRYVASRRLTNVAG